MTVLLTLIRHGQSIWNAIGRSQGQAPVPLSDLGQRQAEYLARIVPDLKPPVAALYCSDLLRCRQTMAPIAAALNLPVTYDPRLREINVGIWQGMYHEEIRTMERAAWEAHFADPMVVRIPGGENRTEMRARAVEAVLEIAARHSNAHVLVVLHGGPISEILRHYGLWPWRVGDPDGPLIGNTARCVIRLSDDAQAAEMILMPDVSHLPPEMVTG